MGDNRRHSTDVKHCPTCTCTNESRFWAKVEKLENGCWEFKGAHTAAGYGVFAWYKDNINGRGRAKYITAHRISWLFAHGAQVPKGMHLCHKCDNPPCVRPDHLFVGTPSQNMQDSIRKGRRPRRTKLTPEQVRLIRARNPKHGEYLSVGNEFGVHAETISSIVNRRSWSWLQ